ncbi:MAG: hypothetical protein HY849_07405 [Nitrosomonadales bacterium]|nr:hypothetical protein [Nitrosomonadales bacterium]
MPFQQQEQMPFQQQEQMQLQQERQRQEQQEQQELQQAFRHKQSGTEPTGQQPERTVSFSFPSISTLTKEGQISSPRRGRFERWRILSTSLKNSSARCAFDTHFEAFYNHENISALQV